MHGHMFGDNVHEFLAPCIYEGEGEMLGMAFFKSLVKQHGREYFEPIGQILHDAGIGRPNLMNPAHLWKLKGPMIRYAAWMTKRMFVPRSHDVLTGMPAELKRHAEWARDFLSHSAMTVSGLMRRHQLEAGRSSVRDGSAVVTHPECCDDACDEPLWWQSRLRGDSPRGSRAVYTSAASDRRLAADRTRFPLRH